MVLDICGITSVGQLRLEGQNLKGHCFAVNEIDNIDLENILISFSL